MIRKIIVSMMVLATVIGMNVVTGARAQTISSTWDGIYTEAQAARGSQQFLQHCSVCHAANLSGNNETPPLVGQFMPDWAGSTMDDLFDYISTTTPLDRPGSLSRDAYVDIVAFILKANGFPAGQSELQADSLLKRLHLTFLSHWRWGRHDRL